jgi:hypothetical protein
VVAARARLVSSWSSLADSAHAPEKPKWLDDLSLTVPRETATQIVTALKRYKREFSRFRCGPGTLPGPACAFSVHGTGVVELRANIKQPRLQDDPDWAIAGWLIKAKWL